MLLTPSAGVRTFKEGLKYVIIPAKGVVNTPCVNRVHDGQSRHKKLPSFNQTVHLHLSLSGMSNMDKWMSRKCVCFHCNKNALAAVKAFMTRATHNGAVFAITTLDEESWCAYFTGYIERKLILRAILVLFSAGPTFALAL